MTNFWGTKLAKIHFIPHFSEYYCIFAEKKKKNHIEQWKKQDRFLTVPSHSTWMAP